MKVEKRHVFDFPTNRFKKKNSFRKIWTKAKRKIVFNPWVIFYIYIYISYESSGKKFFWKNFNFDEDRKKKNFKEVSMKEK